MKELIATRRRQTGSAQAFTLTELLIVMGITAMLASVLLSASFTTQERVLRAECVSNLRKIGVGLNLYSTEANGYLPICGWQQFNNLPWETYEACRIAGPGSTNLTLGFENLGLLFRTKAVPDPKTFYCPSTSRISSIFSYDMYATIPGIWPTIPVGYTGNPYVLTGYNYYPQLRATEVVNDPSYGTVTLPKLTFSPAQLEFGKPTVMTPAKLTEVNPQKSITTDIVASTAYLSHRASGTVAGLNALFSDGRVIFTDARTHNKRGSFQPFDPKLWDPLASDPWADPTGFRLIVNGLVQ